MLHDILPYIYHNEYHPCSPQPEDYLLIYQDQELLMSLGDSIVLPKGRRTL